MLVVHFELGSIDAPVFDLGVVRVLKVSGWAEPLDGAFVTKDAVDGEVGRLGRRLSTLDSLCAVWPKLWHFVSSCSVTLHFVFRHCRINLVILDIPVSFTFVSYILAKADVPAVNCSSCWFYQDNIVVFWRFCVSSRLLVGVGAVVHLTFQGGSVYWEGLSPVARVVEFRFDLVRASCYLDVLPWIRAHVLEVGSIVKEVAVEQVARGERVTRPASFVMPEKCPEMPVRRLFFLEPNSFSH